MKLPTLLIPLAMLCNVAIVGCHDTPTIEPASDPGYDYKQNIINANRVMAQAEQTQIEGYMARHGWQMQQIPDGAFFMEYQPGKGSPLAMEDTVCMRYTVETLTGRVIYADKSDTIVLGRHQPNVGLDLIVQQLHIGSRARAIIPSTLAYGMVGDGDRIPARAILVYDLTILSVTR